MTRWSLLMLVGLLGAQACIDDEAPEPGGVDAPDLYVKALVLSPATPKQGEPVSVTVTIGNQGRVAAQQTAVVSWYPAETYAASGCNWSVGGASSPIRPGGEVSVSCTYAGYPSWYANINTKVEVDETDLIDEGSAAAEANNTYLRRMNVTQGTAPGPDLYVQSLTLNPAVPVMGQPVNVSLTVGNQGDAQVPAAGVVVRWFGGENFPTPGCEWTIAASAPIAPGGSVTVQCTYAGYVSYYAAINTKVVLDATTAIAEGNKTNNTYLQPLSVSRP